MDPLETKFTSIGDAAARRAIQAKGSDGMTAKEIEDFALGKFIEQNVEVPDDVRDTTLLEEVEIALLFVDNTYGRPLSQSRVNKIREKFNRDALGVIYVSMRKDGSLAILDGQHRVAAAKAAGLTKMWARVYIDLSHKEEAGLFARFANVLKQSAMDRFRAAHEEGDEVALDIVRILGKHHLQMAMYQQGVGYIKAAAALTTIYTHYGADTLDEVVTLLYDAWQTDQDGWTLPVLLGMTAFWLRYKGVINKTRLLTVMKSVKPLEITIGSRSGVDKEDAKAMGAQGLWGKKLLRLYNAGLHTNRLEEWAVAYITEAEREQRANRMRGNNYRSTQNREAAQAKEA